MGADHPISWYHTYDGGRAWYTALGHTASPTASLYSWNISEAVLAGRPDSLE